MSRQSRRDFLRASATATACGILLPFAGSLGRTMADETQSPNERPRVGCIGLGGMGRGDAKAVKRYGDILAVCDVDRKRAEFARDEKSLGNGKADIYEDYRKLLDRNDIDLVTIEHPRPPAYPNRHRRPSRGEGCLPSKALTLTIDEGEEAPQGGRGDEAALQVGHNNEAKTRTCS